MVWKLGYAQKPFLDCAKERTRTLVALALSTEKAQKLFLGELEQIANSLLEVLDSSAKGSIEGLEDVLKAVSLAAATKEELQSLKLSVEHFAFENVLAEGKSKVLSSFKGVTVTFPDEHPEPEEEGGHSSDSSDSSESRPGSTSFSSGFWGAYSPFQTLKELAFALIVALFVGGIQVVSIDRCTKKLEEDYAQIGWLGKHCLTTADSHSQKLGFVSKNQGWLESLLHMLRNDVSSILELELTETDLRSKIELLDNCFDLHDLTWYALLEMATEVKDMKLLSAVPIRFNPKLFPPVAATLFAMYAQDPANKIAAAALVMEFLSNALLPASFNSFAGDIAKATLHSRVGRVLLVAMCVHNAYTTLTLPLNIILLQKPLVDHTLKAIDGLLECFHLSQNFDYLWRGQSAQKAACKKLTDHLKRARENIGKPEGPDVTVWTEWIPEAFELTVLLAEANTKTTKDDMAKLQLFPYCCDIYCTKPAATAKSEGPARI